MKNAEFKNIHPLNYNDVKEDLKKYFNDFMENPSKYGIEDEGLAKQIQGVHGLSKHFMWKQFKKQFNIKMNDLATKEAASAFIIDFEQDDDHQLLTHKQLEKILDDPENPDFDLEPDTIEYIKSKDFDRKAFTKYVTEMDPDLKIENQDNFFDKHGDKILEFLLGIWKKMLPIVNKIIDNLVDLGSTTLKNILDKHVPEYLKDTVNDTIDGLGDGLKEVDETLDNLISKEIEETKEEVVIAGNHTVEETAQ